MASSTGPPQGNLKWMTPYPIANDPPTPKPIPDVVQLGKSPAERAVQRFSLAGKHAISMLQHGSLSCPLLTGCSHWWGSRPGGRLRSGNA